ncbi:MAG TPA: 2Fe-2S iron-sulfur cluster-binding protein [Chitinophagaceae bacterium]|jgi:2Fe-2S ferredoxin
MTKPVTDIAVTISCNGHDTIVHTYEHEYRSLMQLIRDQVFVEDFGECGGMGRCATCKVVALNHEYTPEDYERNEWATLTKAGDEIPPTRLSCQVAIDKKADRVHFSIL